MGRCYLMGADIRFCKMRVLEIVANHVNMRLNSTLGNEDGKF